jgi:hypothetical protein
VCITFLPESYRVELQNAGRTARQGKRGSAQLILHTSGKETLQTLRAKRDEKEASAIGQARQDVANMLAADRLFVRYCGVQELASQLREMEIKAFDARRDAIHAVVGVANDVLYDVLGLSAGTVNALGNNLTLGAIPRCNLPHNAFARGQQLGDGLSIALGTAGYFIGEGMQGGGQVMMLTMMLTSGGALVPVATTLAEGGAAVKLHGTVVIGKALLEFSGKNKGQWKKQSDKNDKHTNLKAKITAQENLKEAKAALEKYKLENHGKPGFKKKVKQFEKQIKHWKNKADTTGETHGRKGKGNR